VSAEAVKPEKVFRMVENRHQRPMDGSRNKLWPELRKQRRKLRKRLSKQIKYRLEFAQRGEWPWPHYKPSIQKIEVNAT
jgi:hypothetical protein